MRIAKGFMPALFRAAIALTATATPAHAPAEFVGTARFGAPRHHVKRIAVALTLALACVLVVVSPAYAATHRGNHCTKHAWGGGTVVWTCASIHIPDGQDLASAHGEARHTNGPGPVKLRITAVQLWHYNPNRLLHQGPATPWEVGHAYSHSEYCSFSSAGELTDTVYALVGVDASGAGRSFHWTVRSYNVNLPSAVMGSC